MIAEPPNRRLLVVDDEPLIRDTLRFCLEDKYDVKTVASGMEAIEISKQELFPVVILDLCMAGLSGLETLKRLKMIRETQNIIILTAHQTLDTAIAALNCGAFNYIAKPFNNHRLRNVIARGFKDYDSRTLEQQEIQQRLMGVHDNFFSLLCHEFNTPLNGIIGFSELLAMEVSNPDQASLVNEIQNSGNRLHRVLMEMVDYIAASHLAVAGVKNTFIPHTLLQKLDETSSDLGIHLEIEEHPDAHVTLNGFPDSILMITRKLMSMASQHSSDLLLTTRIFRCDRTNYLLRLNMVARGTIAGLQLSDNQPWYFDAMHPPLNNGSENAISPGLELATCRKIAEYLQGTVEYLVDDEGRIVFSATLPVTR